MRSPIDSDQAYPLHLSALWFSVANRPVDYAALAVSSDQRVVAMLHQETSDKGHCVNFAGADFIDVRVEGAP